MIKRQKKRKQVKWWGSAVALLFLTSGGVTGLAETPADFIFTSSEEGSAAFHHHLVRPGRFTTYLVFIKNPWDRPVSINLALRTACGPAFQTRLSRETVNSLDPGKADFVVLTIHAPVEASPGDVCRATVTAVADGKYQDTLTVTAEVADLRKIYFVSIDSLDPAYLKLNAAGTGEGKEGDWLMPNLHRFLLCAVWYPNAKVHIISATDMNHFNYLAGTMTGTAGIPSVGGFFFGFDEKGRPLFKSSAMLEKSIIRYGPEGKPVKTLFNAVKSSHPQAWTAFVSGKNWVPENYRFPEFQIDRIIHGTKMPEFMRPIKRPAATRRQFVGRTAGALFLPGHSFSGHELGNPAGLAEPQDRREQYPLARLMSAFPEMFPPDGGVMDAAMVEIMDEDPDMLYILLGAVDDAGHSFGAAHDLSEWDTRGTPEVKDDISKYDPRASRQGILNVVREADVQVGLLLNLLERRGTLDDAILVVESDHGMVTCFRDPMLDIQEYLQKNCPLSQKTDYFVGAAASLGLIFKRREVPGMLEQIEKALEVWKVKNPLTGRMEHPVVIYNQQEMKTGFDQGTQKQWLLPREFYSEYYIEHRKAGDQMWPDLLVLTMPHYKFRIQGLGLGNLGLVNAPVKLPEWGFFIGSHGSFETRSCLLIVQVPGLTPAVNQAEVYAMDVAPAIYKLMKWPIPESVDGRGLPGL